MEWAFNLQMFLKEEKQEDLKKHSPLIVNINKLDTCIFVQKYISDNYV